MLFSDPRRLAMPAEDVPVPLAIQLFGPMEVRLRGAPLPRVRSRKSQSLLALLTLRHGREVRRSWLAGLLWPESAGSRAAAYLRPEAHCRPSLERRGRRRPVPT